MLPNIYSFSSTPLKTNFIFFVMLIGLTTMSNCKRLWLFPERMWVGEGSLRWPGRRREYRQGVNVVYFLLQEAIVFATTHHMTPGHSLLIRVVLNPPLPPSQRHTHTHNHSLGCTQWAACYPHRVYRKPPVCIGVD